MNGNNLLESVFKTGDGVFAVDQEQRIIFWNQGAEAILGYSAEEVMAEPCFQVIRGMDESGCVICSQRCPTIGCARQGKLSPGQNVRVRAKNGAPHWLSVTHTLVEASGGTFTALVHIFRDVTTEVEAKKMVREVVQRFAEQVSGYGPPQGTEGAENALEAPLTEREKQVLGLLAQGDGTATIAKKLTISNTTARNHIQSILTKLGVHTRLEAVVYATKHQVVDPALVKRV